MDEDQRQQLAEARAEVYAPAPTGGATMAGVCVAVVALVGDLVVSGFYGWRVQDHLVLATAITFAGFGVGVAAYKSLARVNRRAARAERRELDAGSGCSPGPRSSLDDEPVVGVGPIRCEGPPNSEPSR